MIIVQVGEDPVDVAALKAFLRCHGLVKQKDLVCSTLAKLLHESVGRGTFGRLARLHERRTELGLGCAVKEVEQASRCEANTNGLTTNKANYWLLALMDCHQTLMHQVLNSVAS